MAYNAYNWPNYYDCVSTGLDGDIFYYVELAKQIGGPVLELGCGTGRCTLAIAKAGIPIVGVDLSEAMLQRAHQKASSMNIHHMIRWIQANMIELQLNQTFPLIVIPYRSFMHLTTIRDQVEALKRIRNHLTDDGVLAFNVFVPHIHRLLEQEGKPLYLGIFPIPGTHEVVEVTDYTEYDHFAQIAQVTRYMERFDERGVSLERIRTEFQLRYTFPSELTHLLNLCGFKIVNRFGSFNRTPFDRDSHELILEVVKRR